MQFADAYKSGGRGSNEWSTRVFRKRQTPSSLDPKMMLKWLAAALDGKSDLSDVGGIVFEGWPQYQVRLDVCEASMRSSMMEAFLSLQENFNRSYSVVKYQTPNLNRLTNEEKSELEIEVKVRDGSSDFSSDIWKQVELSGDPAFHRQPTAYRQGEGFDAGQLAAWSARDHFAECEQ